jgi:hypothetical protein
MEYYMKIGKEANDCYISRQQIIGKKVPNNALYSWLSNQEACTVGSGATSKRDKGRLQSLLVSSIRFVEQFQNGLVDYTKYEQLYPAQVTWIYMYAWRERRVRYRDQSRRKGTVPLVDTVRRSEIERVGMQNRTANTTTRIQMGA